MDDMEDSSLCRITGFETGDGVPPQPAGSSNISNMDCLITMDDDAYDHFILAHYNDEDQKMLSPSRLYRNVLGHLSKLEQALESLSPEKGERITEFLDKQLATMVYGSNHIGGVGSGYDVTMHLCQRVFDGHDIASDIDVEGPEYEMIASHIRQTCWGKNSPWEDHKQAEVVRQRYREIVQHAKAAAFLVHELTVKGRDLTEEIILEAHGILTPVTAEEDYEYGCSAHNCHGSKYRTAQSFQEGAFHGFAENPDPIMVWHHCPGTYRTTHSSVGTGTGYSHQYPHPTLIPHLMADMLASLDKDIRAANETGHIDTLALAAKYSHIFNNIYPFIKGNGQLSRLILNCLLLKHGGFMACFGVDEKQTNDYRQITGMTRIPSRETEVMWDEHETPSAWQFKELASHTLMCAEAHLREFVDLMTEDCDEEGSMVAEPSLHEGDDDWQSINNEWYHYCTLRRGLLQPPSARRQVRNELRIRQPPVDGNYITLRFKDKMSSAIDG